MYKMDIETYIEHNLGSNSAAASRQIVQQAITVVCG